MKIKNCKLKINNRGFTLVELLVYVGIFAVVSGLMIGIMTTTLRVNQRESASAEATSQLNFVLQTIQRLVRESSAIIVNSNSANVDTDDTVGSQQTLLVLRMKDSVGDNSTDRDPIIIYAENNVIKMSEGRLGYQRVSDLTNSRVLADNLKFTKYTQYPGQDTVGVDIQLTYNSQNPDSIVSRSLRTAIARVSAATFDSNLLPGADNTYEIGYLAGNQRWKNISVSNLISTSNLLNLGQLTNDPSSDVQNGSIYYNTASSTFRGYKNSAWANLGGGDLWTASSTAIYYNTGNVGIGTTNPVYNLDINKAVSGGVISRLYNSAAGTGTYAQFIIGSDIANFNFNSLSSTWTNSGINYASGHAINGAGAGGFSLAAGNAAGVMRFYTGGNADANERMRINSSGNVGIGTSTPQVSLDISALNNNPFSLNTLARITNTGTAGGILNLTGGGVGARTFSLMSSGSGNAIGAGKFEIGNFAGANYLVIDGSNGYVGIGTSAPNATLDVVGTVSIFQPPITVMTLGTLYTATTDLLFMCNLAGGSFTYITCNSGPIEVYSQNNNVAVNQAGCSGFAYIGEQYYCTSPGMSGSSFSSRVYKLGK